MSFKIGLVSGGIAAFGFKPFGPFSEVYGYYIAKLAIFPDMAIEYAEKHKPIIADILISARLAKVANIYMDFGAKV